MTHSTVQNSALPAFKAVIWDVDGTLVDSEPIHAQSVIKTCADKDICIAETDLHQFLGKSHYDTYKRVLEHTGLDMVFEEFIDQCIQHYVEDIEKIQLRDDVADVIHMLDAQGIRQAIFSNNPGSVVNPTAKLIERRLGKKNFFSPVISLDDVARKPDPEGFLLAAKQLGLDLSECIIVEDSSTGAKAGKNASIFTIAWEHGNADQLQDADLIVSGNLMSIFS